MKTLLAIMLCLSALFGMADIPITYHLLGNRSDKHYVNKVATWGSQDVLNGLVAWWKLDGNALDSIGSNNGNAIGATPTNNAAGKNGYYFNGIDAYIDLGTSVLYSQSLSSATISLWVYTEVLNSNALFLDDCGGGGAGAGILFYFDNSIPHFLYAGDGNGGNIGYTTSILGWHHFAVSASATSSILYLDGSPLVTSSWHPRSQNRKMTLGAVYYYGVSSFTKCIIRDVRIYDRPLSQNEISVIASK